MSIIARRVGVRCPVSGVRGRGASIIIAAFRLRPVSGPGLERVGLLIIVFVSSSNSLF